MVARVVCAQTHEWKSICLILPAVYIVRFPQKLPRRTDIIPAAEQKELQQNLSNWPIDVSSSDLWDEQIREELRKNKIAEAELNVRRSKVRVYHTLNSAINDSFNTFGTLRTFSLELN